MKSLWTIIALTLFGSAVLADDPFPVAQQPKRIEPIPDLPPMPDETPLPKEKASTPYPSPIPTAPFDVGAPSKTPTRSSHPKAIEHFHDPVRPPWDIEPPAAVQGKGACNFDPVGDKLIFSPDFWSYQFLLRPWFSQTLSVTSGKTDLVEAVFRAGYMLTAPSLTEHPFRGNWEAVCELSFARVHEGSGKSTFGLLPAMRYNFVRLNPEWFPSAATLPYVQLGAGFLFNDIYKDREQNRIGQAVEFQVQASVGSRWALSPAWTLDFEVSYRYLNNLGLAPRNDGLNMFGVGVGATYSFPAGTR